MPLKGSLCCQPAGGSAISQSRDGRIVDIESAGLIRRAGLCPVDPQTKLEPVPVGKVGDTRDAVGKLCRMRLPVADAAKPARIEMKHLQARARAESSIMRCARVSSTAMPLPQLLLTSRRIGRIAQRARIVEHGAHPAPHDIAGAVRAAARMRRRIRSAFQRCRQAAGEFGRGRAGIEPRLASQRCAVALQCYSGAPAEFDADIPARAGSPPGSSTRR